MMIRFFQNCKKLILFPLLLSLCFVILFHLFSPPHTAKMNDYSRAVVDQRGDFVHISLNYQDQWRLPTDLHDVDPKFIDALIDIEDKRFYRHWGVDPLALGRAFFHYLKNGKITSGGSTLSMQIIRMLDQRPRTIFSKLMEIYQALRLERHLSKQDLLHLYLSLTPYGGNVHGLHTACLRYLGKTPALLSYAEIAFLIAYPQSPTVYRKNPNALLSARNHIVRKLNIPDHLKKEALEEKLPQHIFSFPKHAIHLAFKLYRQHPQDILIPTALNLSLQKKVENLIHAWQFKEGQNAAVLILDKKGNIISYMGSRDYFNDSIEGKVDMLPSIRSPGSTLKPFIYGFAFDENMIHPETLIDDKAYDFKGYKPTNFHEVFHGLVTLRQALQQSLNIPAVAVLEKIGPHYFLSRLKENGIDLHFPSHALFPSLPIALGGVGIRLMDLAYLYGALNNEGRFNNTVLMKKQSAMYLLDILKNAPPPHLFFDQEHTHNAPIAFKTGTSYGYRDALCVGLNGDYTVLVWCGKANGGSIQGQTGRTDAAPLLFQIFHTLLPKPVNFMETQSCEHDLLPEKLRYFHKQVPLATASEKLKIIFPLEGSLFMKNTPIPFQLKKGQSPCSVFINDVLYKKDLQDHQIFFTPENAGFYTLLVMNDKGQESRVSFSVR